MKKLLSFLLAALVLASVCVPTFAEAEIIEGPVRAFYDEPAAGGEAEAPDAGLVIVEEDGPVIEEPAGDGEDHEHQWVDYERKEPTCDELGWTKSRCSVCGAEKTFNLGWLGHYFPEGLKEPPNLFGDYWATCQRCGKRFKFNTGKEPDVPIAKPPCGPGTVDDLPEAERELFHSITPTEELTITGRSAPNSACPYKDTRHGSGHSHQIVTQSGTCTEWGYIMVLPCTKCGISYSAACAAGEEDNLGLCNGKPLDFEYTDPPLGHDFESYPPHETVTAATCTEPGLENVYCARCHDEHYTQVVPASGHTIRMKKYYEDIDGDGVEETVREIACERCGEQFSANILGFTIEEGGARDIVGAEITFTDEAGNVTSATGMNGDFAYFADLAPGRYTMTAKAEGYATRTCCVVIGEDTLLEADVYLNTTGEYKDTGFIDIGDAVFTFPQDSYIETGEPLTPPVTVTYKGVELVEGEDYTVEYANNIHAGNGYAKVKGIGFFKGHYNAPFWIRVGMPDDPGPSSPTEKPDPTPVPSTPAPTPVPDDKPAALTFSEDGKTVTATGDYKGLFARVALVIDNNGVSGLYVTQVTVNDDGSIVIPSFQVPGLRVTAVNISLVPTVEDIQSATPNVKATSFRML